MASYNKLSSSSPAGPSTSTSDTTPGSHATNPTGSPNTPNTSSDANSATRPSQLLHTAMRAYPVVEALTQYAHRSDIQCLALASPALYGSISTSGVLRHSRHWEGCTGDMACYGCDTRVCEECSQPISIQSRRLPVPLLQGRCPHNPIMVLHTPGPNNTLNSMTRQIVCRMCATKSEEQLMEGCLKMALKRVTTGAASQITCQKCVESQ